jgi:hypothetical protein
MRQFLMGLGVSGVFLAGCVAGASNFVVPKAEAARAEEQRWAYFCFDANSAEEIHTKANSAGARGWELVTSVVNPTGDVTWCFRQPR